MTTKVLSGTYSSGYVFGAPITTVSVTTSGYIEGIGLESSSSAAYTVVNQGRVVGASAGVYLRHGGMLTNGGDANTTALIQGVGDGASIRNGPGVVTNYGVILAATVGANPGVYLDSGGAVTNGSVVDDVAKIVGGVGVSLRGPGGTVTNYGTIVGAYKHEGSVVAGVYVSSGQVVNGSLTDTRARIAGQIGVVFEQFTGTAALANFGTIQATGTGGDYAVAFEQGAAANLTNGAAIADVGALIQGNGGVFAQGAITIHNFATIEGLAAAAITLNRGGDVINGSAGDHGALVEGYQGIVFLGGVGSVTNFGTIEGVGATAGPTEFGLSLQTGGTLTNGAVNDRTALIEGYGGLRAYGAGSSSNFGTIQGTGGVNGGDGVYLGNGASLTNGAANDKSALIAGYLGAALINNATLTNFGTIAGAGGVALNAYGGDTLVVEAGSAFEGQVNGNSASLVLASGVGVISGVSQGNVTVSGSMATTTFQNFSTVEVGAGATFTDTGAVTIAAGQTVNAAGTLTLGGSGAASIVNTGLIEATGAGLLTLKGAVSGTGTVKIGGGTLFAASTFNQPVTFNGATGVLELAKSQTYTAAIRGVSKTGGTSLDLNDIAFGGSTKATYSGTATSGTLTVTDGTHTAHIKLIGDYRAATFVTASDGHGGTTIHDPTKPQGPPDPALLWADRGSGHRFIAAMAGLGAGGAGGAIHVGEARAAREPLLVKPRPMMA